MLYDDSKYKQDPESKRRRKNTFRGLLAGVSSVVVLATGIGLSSKTTARDVNVEVANDIDSSISLEHTFRTEDLQDFWRDVDDIAKEELLPLFNDSEILYVKTNLTPEETAIYYFGALLNYSSVEHKTIYESFQHVFKDMDKLSTEDATDAIYSHILGSNYDPSNREQAIKDMKEVCNGLLNKVDDDKKEKMYYNAKILKDARRKGQVVPLDESYVDGTNYNKIDIRNYVNDKSDAEIINTAFMEEENKINNNALDDMMNEVSVESNKDISNHTK